MDTAGAASCWPQQAWQTVQVEPPWCCEPECFSAASVASEQIGIDASGSDQAESAARLTSIGTINCSKAASRSACNDHDGSKRRIRRAQTLPSRSSNVFGHMRKHMRRSRNHARPETLTSGFVRHSRHFMLDRYPFLEIGVHG